MHALRAAISVSAIRLTQDIVVVMRGLADFAVIACATSFVLVLATAISNYLRFVVGHGATDWGAFLGQFVMPMAPLMVALVLLATRQRAASMAVASCGAVFTFLWWMTLAI